MSNLPTNSTDYFVHPRALVEEGARIGPRTRVWAFAHVQANTDFGADCNVCNYVFVESGAQLGNGVTVKNGVQIWQGVTAEDGVFFGPNCVLTNDPRPRSRQDFGLRTTVIQEGATIGAAAVILCDFSIGRFAFVGAGSLVTREVPSFAMVWGRPARFQYWISRAAERLDFTDSQREVTCPKSGRVYRLVDDAVVELEGLPRS